MAQQDIIVSPVSGKAELQTFMDFAWEVYKDDPNWVPPLKMDVKELLTPGKNPFFEHAEAQYFLSRKGGKVTGRISAHIDRLAQGMPADQGFGPGTGNWGMFEATDAVSAAALIAAAEEWLRAKGVTRAIGPISLSIWEEPGLLVHGFDHPPTVMMGHDRPEYQGWIEAAGYTPVKQLNTFDLDITKDFPPLIKRIVESGNKNPRIRIRDVDKSKFDEEAATILAILNDAWGKNWGFVPITDSEIAFTGKKLKPIVYEDLIRIAELDGEPVAFMMTLPDLNEKTGGFNGNLFPFNILKLLWWLRKPKVKTMRVPLMGVLQRLQSSRMASQLAFMMIETIRQASITKYGATRAEIGWILEDNQGMVAIANAIESRVNKSYIVYDRTLG
ncbi:MAG TPA: N-acetyltransferase [Sphingobium sp.]